MLSRPPPAATEGMGSSIQLPKSFISADRMQPQVLQWQTSIHVASLLSAIAIACTDKLRNASQTAEHRTRHMISDDPQLAGRPSSEGRPAGFAAARWAAEDRR